MSISGIASGSSTLASLSQTTSQSSAVGARRVDQDGDADGQRRSGSRRGGAVASAITQALAQIGITVQPAAAKQAAASNGIDGADNPPSVSQQALNTFMHDLLVALHSQGGAQTPAAAGDASAQAAASSGIGDQRKGGGLSLLESKLSSLIKQLSGNGDGSTGSSASSATATGNADLGKLQEDFQSLLSSQGGSASKATLTDFLQSISQNLQGASPLGNIVSTKV